MQVPATHAMVSTMGLSACGSNRALTSERPERTRSRPAHPQLDLPRLRQGLHWGEERTVHQKLYRPLFAYKSTSGRPYKDQPPKSLGTVPGLGTLHLL